MSPALPLPLSPFEHFALDTDRPPGRLQFFARLRFAGCLDRDAFTRAAEATLARHPLCTARLATTAGGERAWLPDAGGLRLDWLDERDPAPGLAPQPLERAPGLAVCVRAGARQSTLDLRVHHAVCDGHAMIQLLGDFLLAYAAATGAREAAWPALDPGLLATRARFGLTPSRALRVLPRQLLGLIGIRRALFRRPLHLAPTATTPAGTQGPEVWGETCTLRLDRATTRKLRDAARRHGVSEHDLLLRDLFLVLGGALASNERRRFVRLSVVVDLRSFEQRRMPAANVISQVFLDRRLSELDRPDALLRGLHGEMSLILGWRLALTFVAALAIGRAVPRLWPAIVADHPRIGPTALVTHLGTLSGPRRVRAADGRMLAGDQVLESLEIAPPLPPGVALAFVIYRYGGELHASLRFDSAVHPAATARQLLDSWRERIAASAADA